MGYAPKKTTWAGRQTWEGFRRGIAYCLDCGKVWNLPIKQSGEETTVGKVFESLKDTESLAQGLGITLSRLMQRL
jgi:hypothetical protein